MTLYGLCEWCGYEKDLARAGACEACVPAIDEWERKREERLARWRVAPDDPERLPMTWAEACAAVEPMLGAPVTCQESDGIEAAAWWHVPQTWIGCLGFIVDKRTGEVTQLGSSNDLDTWLWAYTRGALSTPCDFTVTEVGDTEETLRFLRHVGRSIPFNPGAANKLPRPRALREMLTRLPLTLRGVSLWPSLYRLREHDAAGHFVFTAIKPGDDGETDGDSNVE